MKNIYINIILIIFCFFLSLYNLKEMTIVSADPYYVYLHTPNIRILYYAAILIDILFIVTSIFLIINLRNANVLKSSKISRVLFSISIIFILNIFLELYLGSTFYYGEVRDKQVLPILVNNFGFLGCTIVLIITLINLIDLNQIFTVSRKKILYLLIIIIVLIFFSGSYLVLHKTWNL